MSPKRPLQITSLSAIHHMLNHCPQKIKSLLVADEPSAKGRQRHVIDLAREQGIALERARGKRECATISALVSPFCYWDLKKWLESRGGHSRLVLALDHLQDPQNFGAICRCAEGLGADGILIPKDRSVEVSEGVYNASVGTVETLPIIRVTNLREGLRRLRKAEYWIVGATRSASAIAPNQMPDWDKVVLVLGAEWEGLSQAVQKDADALVEIPLAGHVESLNVSATAAILLYQLTKNKTRS